MIAASGVGSLAAKPDRSSPERVFSHAEGNGPVLWAMAVPTDVLVGTPISFPDVLVEWPTVYPPWSLVRGPLDQASYRRRYRHQLHRLAAKVLAELQEREGYDAPLVLLCHWTSPGATASGGCWPSGSASIPGRGSPSVSHA